jgi:hypothetical protein
MVQRTGLGIHKTKHERMWVVRNAVRLIEAKILVYESDGIDKIVSIFQKNCVTAAE